MAPPSITTVEAKIHGLRELMETNFNHVQERLDTLQDALEKLADATVTEEAYQFQMQSVQKAHQRLDNHALRLTKVEQVARILQIVGAIAGAVLIAMLVALATGKAQIVWP